MSKSATTAAKSKLREAMSSQVADSEEIGRLVWQIRKSKAAYRLDLVAKAVESMLRVDFGLERAEIEAEECGVCEPDDEAFEEYRARANQALCKIEEAIALLGSAARAGEHLGLSAIDEMQAEW